MQHNEILRWQRWNRMLNALLVLALCLIVAQVAWGLDTQDIEWTPEGKTLAIQRVAEWQPKEEMVVVPVDPFQMGARGR